MRTKDIRELPTGSLIPGTDWTKSGDVFMKEVGTKGRWMAYADLTCGCGAEKTVQVNNVRRGGSQRCLSCSKSGERNTQHKDGRGSHPLYGTWKRMKHRCYNPNGKDYHRYGGRGISIHESFLDFWTYAEYMESLPNYDRRDELNLTVDRIDNDGNYEPGNLRWATKSEQRTNQR